MTVTYRIKNTFLPTGYLEKIMFDTLDMHRRGEDLTNSPVAAWGRKTLEKKGWWYGCEEAENKEECITQRLQKVVNLYYSIKENGYNGSLISVFFNKKTGRIHTYDGFHRLCILKYLGIVTLLNVVISQHDPNLACRGDFPLVETLIQLNNGKNLYQPVDDERVKDFHVWRKDSSKRLEYVLKNIVGKSVLDFGCCEGYFSRELAKKGYSVTAVDVDSRRVAVARYLSIINNLEVNFQVAKWENYLQQETHFDNILFLSVFHHNILAVGVDNAFKLLCRFKNKARQVFFEAPISAGKISWTSKNKKDLYDFTLDEFKAKIEKETEMKIKDTWHGKRYIFLLEAT